MHKEWNKNKIGEKISTRGVPRVEIDESKIIRNANQIFWIFGIIDLATKECRDFIVLDNRGKETLLPLFIKNVATYYDIIEMEHRYNAYLHRYFLSAHVYNDCWRAYNPIDFKNNGFYLLRINHSIW